MAETAATPRWVSGEALTLASYGRELTILPHASELAEVQI